MSLIDAYPLRQIAEIPKDQIPLLYSALMSLIVRLGKAGLIHGDFNEFNLLIREKRTPEEEEHEQAHDPFKQYPSNGPFGQKVGTEPPPELAEGEKWEEGKNFARIVATPSTSANGGASELSDEDDDEGQQESEDEDAVNQDESPIHLSDGATVEPILIDFPQMISVLHPNADYYFNRDVQCVRRFFRRRFRFISEEFPKFRDVRPGDVKEWDGQRRERERRRERLGFRVPPQSEKAAGGEASSDDENADLGVYLDLDVLTKASGYLTEVKKRGEYEELDQYMARMRMDGSGDEGLSEDEEDEVESEEDEEVEGEDLEGEGADGESKTLDLMPPSEVEPPLGPRSKRKPAAPKVVDEEEASSHAKLIAQRIANERSTRKKQEMKHHSKGKTGRTHPGGKGRSESVKDASVF
jgi:RIO kinase 2